MLSGSRHNCPKHALLAFFPSPVDSSAACMQFGRFGMCHVHSYQPKLPTDRNLYARELICVHWQHTQPSPQMFQRLGLPVGTTTNHLAKAGPCALTGHYKVACNCSQILFNNKPPDDSDYSIFVSMDRYYIRSATGTIRQSIRRSLTAH
jgi:hypothetical protein